MQLDSAPQLLRLARASAVSVLARKGLAPVPDPINVTLSVTNRCQSRCRTCMIWKLYRDDPGRAGEELRLHEIERTFRSMRPCYFFNISGGEPFLRADLPDIVELAVRHLKPAVIHAPTNAIAHRRVRAGVEDILGRLARLAPSTVFTLKPSFDGLHTEHDRIRGVRGNFGKVLHLLDELAPLRHAHPNFKVGLGTVVSTLNVEHLDAIAEYVETLHVDSYINEIAELRSEMFNAGEGITPDAAVYAAAMERFKKRTEAMLRTSTGLARVTLAFRLYYYDLVVRILREGRQVIPCYAGISNVHISPYGDVWPCCIRAYEGSFGDLRAAGYDFRRVWRSRRADAVRRDIRREGGCACPLANQAYSNMLLDPRALAYVLRRLWETGRSTRQGGTP